MGLKCCFDRSRQFFILTKTAITKEIIIISINALRWNGIKNHDATNILIFVCKRPAPRTYWIMCCMYPALRTYKIMCCMYPAPRIIGFTQSKSEKVFCLYICRISVEKLIPNIKRCKIILKIATFHSQFFKHIDSSNIIKKLVFIVKQKKWQILEARKKV